MTPINTANKICILLIWTASKKLKLVVVDVGFFVCCFDSISKRSSSSLTFCLSFNNSCFILSRSNLQILLLFSSFSNRCNSLFAVCIAWFWCFHLLSKDLIVASAWFNLNWSSSCMKQSINSSYTANQNINLHFFLIYLR